MIKAILLDISGVLYVDQQAVSGAVAAVNALVAEGLPLRFVTNTSRKTRQQIHEDLCRHGFRVHLKQIFTAPQAAAQLLRRRGLRPLCLIHPNLEEEFAEFSRREPNAVLIGDAGHRFDYVHLNQAFQVLQQGAPLIAIGDNRYYRSQGQLFLDAGPFVKALEYATGSPAEVVGKPAPSFFQEALDSLGCKADQALMIGDDVAADVAGALQAGLQGCLVKTGKYQPGDESLMPDGGLLSESVVEAIQQARDINPREAPAPRGEGNLPGVAEP